MAPPLCTKFSDTLSKTKTCFVSKHRVICRACLPHHVAGDLQELARREMLDMIERLLLEADLEDQLPKLEVYGKTIDGIKELLRFLLMDPNSGELLQIAINFPPKVAH